MNANELRAEIVRCGYTLAEFSDKTVISKASLYRKISKNREFSASEIKRIIGVLNLPQEKVMQIFFDD